MKKQLWQYFSGGGGFSYVPLPIPPAFSNTQLLDSAVIGSAIELSETNSKKDLLVKNPFTDRLRPNGLIGTSGAPYRIKSESDSVYSVVGGDVLATGQQVIGCLNSPDYIEFYHLMIVGHSNPVTVTGVTGIQLTANSTGSHFKVSDCVVKNVSFAGFQSNSAQAAGSVASLVIEFIRVFGHSLDGECFYIGNTNKPTDFAVITFCSVTNSFFTNKGRDGCQLNDHVNVYVGNCTFYDVGKAAVSQQQSLTQVQNSNGLVENCLMYLGPEFCTIGTHGFEFKNCYFYASARGSINKASTDYPGSPMLNGQAIKFTNCHFGSPNAIAEAIRILEDECDIQFTNCTKDSNITNLFLDSRADKVTHSITETGTTTMATVAPQFISLDPNDTENHGKLLTSYLISRKIGYRTKTT